ncbi:NACHT domain-containing protein [Mesorhizobium sp. 43Arga]
MCRDFDNFIELDRTFRDLAISDDEGDEAKMVRLWGRETPTHWADLLVEPRVIVLAEAGSGKTEEIRHICRRQRRDGKHAFFLRIEHVSEDFETSFEEGSPEEFEAWIVSAEPGWLFLDSIDEARLRDPKDFERAIRKIGRKIERILQQAHIIITGRTEAWRPTTDLLLCRSNLPWMVPATGTQNEPEFQGEYTLANDRTIKRPNVKEPFRIVTLEDLHGSQVDTFARAKGVVDLKAFRKAVDRAEAWSFTTRPLDLAETIEFWNDHQSIGSRLDLMTSSIAKRLEERDQDRADARPISIDRVREGARLIAAATTLCQESAIRVPDGHQNTKGLPIKDVLTDWNDQDCTILLSRPIFDPGIYGTVRFHHRSVREYLTAEWLNSLLVDEGSRAKIESLFFRKQYGIEVIVPTMRPVLPWLAVLDRRILNKVVDLAPEILFEGGDPSKLPLETRRRILRQTCEQLAQPAHGRSVMDFEAVQRFSNPDLADDIRALLDRYAGDEDITWFLLRMVFQGGLEALADKAKHFALTSRAKYTRIAAIRAVLTVGTPTDVAEVRRNFVGEEPPLSRDWLAELLVDLPHTMEAIAWLMEALEGSAAKDPHQVDPLNDPLARCVNELPLALLGPLMEGLVCLLEREPVFERRHCEISQQYGWLASTAARVAIRLIEARDPAAFSSATLRALCLLPMASDHGRHDFEEIRKELPDLVKKWPDLNHAVFWQSVTQERAWRAREKVDRLVDYWYVSIFGSYWGFDPTSFDIIEGDVANRPLLDDRLIALTLAFRLFVAGGRPRKWRERLKRLAAKDDALRVKLETLLHPPAGGMTKFRRREAQWKRRDARISAAREKRLERDRALLAERVDQIRDPGTAGMYTHDQHYLHERMRGAADDSSNHWTEGNWRSLIETYGEPVASAFRDATVRFWRDYQPQTRSLGAPANQTPFAVIFGLTGLAIEAREEEHWVQRLTPAEAERAAQYALAELNGFPAWLPELHGAFPDQVVGVLLKEIRHELATETSDGESHYVLYDMAWHGEWARDQIATALLPTLSGKRVNPLNLGYLLSIIQGSSVSDAEVAKIAARKASAKYDPVFSPIWYATWVGVDPDAAIPAFAARLAALNDPIEQTSLALRFVVPLLGGRRQEGRARLAYRTVGHMKALYLLMTRYIREEDDIERAGTGVYSPGLRDDAQDARNALFTFIRETPGKEAYLALMEMERTHPAARSRPWMGFHAKTKATLDADFAPWKPSQVKQFNDARVATPANHRELWYFGVERLEDLKHDLEHADESIASILQGTDQETEFRKFIGGWLRDKAGGRYSIPSEEELADAKRPDLRFRGATFDAPVPVELKVADNWTGPHLFERMEVQLGGDYLRDVRSSRGIFLLVYIGTKKSWDLPGGGKAESFEALLTALRQHWSVISSQYPNVEDLAVVGIDLTLRGLDTRTVKAAAKARKSAEKDKGAGSATPREEKGASKLRKRGKTDAR